jgi:hypothetical protein
MSPNPRPITFTDVEIRSYLPTGWSLAEAGRRGWDRNEKTWSVDVADGADNVWTVCVAADAARTMGRLEALREGFDRLQRKALGRHSVLTG